MTESATVASAAGTTAAELPTSVELPSSSAAAATATAAAATEATEAKAASEEAFVPERLKLLTYNFLLRPPPVTYNGHDYKDARLAEFVERHLRDYDVVAFQEVFGLLSRRRARLIAQAATRTGHAWAVHSPAPALRFLTDGGLLILSRHPIVARDAVSFAPGINADVLAMKGALYARLELRRRSGRPAAPAHVHVFTTHLQADYEKNNERSGSSDGNAPNRAMRRQQLRTLLQFVRAKTAGDADPIVVLGDFNINSRRAPTDGADSDEYLEALDVFRACGFAPRDLLRECSPDGASHPVTICDSVELADGTLVSTEPQLTPRNEFHLRRSIDYVFALERVGLPSAAIQCPSYVVDIGSVASTSAEAAASSSSSSSAAAAIAAGAPSLQQEHATTERDMLLATSTADSVGGWCVPSRGRRGGKRGMLSCFLQPWRMCGVWGMEKSKDEDANTSENFAPEPLEMHLPPGPMPAPAHGRDHTVVEKFVSHAGLPYHQLSDHYGVSSLWLF